MTTTTAKVMTIDTNERQEKYVKDQRRKGKGLGIVFADAFLRGMRDIGYKDPSWALAEHLDNSFQAGADKVAIRFGFKAGSNEVKPDMFALIDNGNGMIPEMIGYAVRWGGTDREGDRNGFGRYGYGLPSAAVSLGKRYTVYSKTAKSNDWYAVTVDIEELADAANDASKTEELLTAKLAQLPEWVLAAKGQDGLDLRALKSGTVIVFEQLDRLNRLPGWIKVDTLRTKLLQRFGVIYRHWIPERRIFVDGVETQVVDPLFLMEHGRHFAETSVRAEPVEGRTFEVTTPSGVTGTVRVRASALPPNFQLANPADWGKKGAKLADRFPIMREYHGLLICRQRRQIDTIQPKWTKFQNYDVNVKVEIDFDPELDEYFGITTSKQQITIDDAMWEILRNTGSNGGAVYQLINDIRARRDEVATELDAKAGNVGAGEETPRNSITAMEETEKFKEVSVEPTPVQLEEGKKNLEELAEKKAEATGKPKEAEVKKLEEETKKRQWEVEFASIPDGPFYRPVRLGLQKRLVINTDHPFFSKVYAAAPEVQSALEVLLFVIAERELEASGDAATFYRAERPRWSDRLRRALDHLKPEDAMRDKASAVAEKVYQDAEESA